PEGIRLNSYPVAERYGFLWVYSGTRARHEIPVPPGLEEGRVSALFVKGATLFAHHHVLMANGIDLQHFDSVHGLAIEFDFEVREKCAQVFDWNLSGEVPASGLRGRLARFLLGNRFGYRVRFAGGSIATITYGNGQRFRGKGFRLP